MDRVCRALAVEVVANSMVYEYVVSGARPESRIIMLVKLTVAKPLVSDWVSVERVTAPRFTAIVAVVFASEL